jgi:hypothetical protein
MMMKVGMQLPLITKLSANHCKRFGTASTDTDTAVTVASYLRDTWARNLFRFEVIKPLN